MRKRKKLGLLEWCWEVFLHCSFFDHMCFSPASLRPATVAVRESKFAIKSSMSTVKSCACFWTIEQNFSNPMKFLGKHTGRLSKTRKSFHTGWLDNHIERKWIRTSISKKLVPSRSYGVFSKDYRIFNYCKNKPSAFRDLHFLYQT